MATAKDPIPATMSKNKLRELLVRNDLRQIDCALICGVGVRQARSWCLGEYPVPQAAMLLLMAYDEGKINAEWLARRLKKAMQ